MTSTANIACKKETYLVKVTYNTKMIEEERKIKAWNN